MIHQWAPGTIPPRLDSASPQVNSRVALITAKIDFMRCTLLVLLALPALAQQKFTAADYQRAEKAMTYNTAPLVYRSGVRPNWLPDERFWYRVTTPEGAEFILVDPAKGTRTAAFDRVKLAAALSTAAGRTVDAKNMPFQTIEFTSDGQSVIV